MRRSSLVALPFLFSLALAPQADSQETDACFDLWLTADVDRNGALEKAEDQGGFIAAVETARGGTLAAGILSRDEFIASCRQGHFSNVAAAGAGPRGGERPADPGPLGNPLPQPLPKDRGKGDITPGVQTLNEADARKRLRANGFAEVSELALEPTGIWRGTAIVNGKRVPVAVDPQGDIIGGR